MYRLKPSLEKQADTLVDIVLRVSMGKTVPHNVDEWALILDFYYKIQKRTCFHHWEGIVNEMNKFK